MRGTRFYTEIVSRWDGERLVTVRRKGAFEWAGPVAMCKGDSTAQAAEQQQMAFNQQLMSIFQGQYQMQQGVLNFLKAKLEPMINNPTGYSPEALAAMRTSATDTISQQSQNAQAALNNEENAKNGGSDLPSGTTAQLDAALLNAEAQQNSSAQNTITLNNENLKQSNLWNAMNVLSGNVAQQFNPLGYANAANQGGNTVANLSEANTQASNSGFWGSFMKGLGSGFGNLLTGGNSTGGSSLGSWFGVCHVAASFWGWASPKTKLVRLWMLAKAPAWLRKFYAGNSAWISRTPLRWAFRPLFGYVLARYA